MYIEFDTPSCLKPYLDCYWSYHSSPLSDLRNNKPVIPDGCVDLIFDLNLSAQSKCFVVGPMTMPIINKHCHLFGVRLKPGMASSFFNFPVKDITDQIIDLRAIKKNGIEGIAEEIAHKSSFLEAIFILNRMFKNVFPERPLIEKETAYAIHLLTHINGKCRIENISRKLGWSRQHLTRKFLEHVGLSPKFFSQVMRAHHLIKYYKSGEYNNWAELAQICGYYDQAHMINDFKKITGATPQNFLKKS